MKWHAIFEKNVIVLLLGTLVTVAIGGIVEIVPLYTIESTIERVKGVRPYSPLELAGRNIYIREGCYTCHSQMVRPFRDETLRYGEWSHAVEYSWDRPFQLGSRRIGPDLHRVGGKYPDSWHYEHMKDPRSTSPGSVMPPYDWLLTQKIDPNDVRKSLKALRTVGTPYSDEEIDNVAASLEKQGKGIVDRMASTGITVAWDDEIVAMTAYLQRLGTDRPKGPVAAGGE